MKVLAAISTCWKGFESNQAIRETWGASLPEGWDLKFFLGGRYFTEKEWKKLNTIDFIGSPGTLGRCDPSKMSKVRMDLSILKGDEIVLPQVDDGYLGLPWKTTESLRWAMDRDYDFVVRGFEDTYLFPHVMAKSDVWIHDAAGWNFGCGPCPAHPTISHGNSPLGGAGYTTSRKAMEAILDPSNCSLDPLYSSHWGEDTMVGWALTKANLPLFDDHRFVWDKAIPAAWNRAKFSIHMCDRGRKWNPQEMLDVHAEILNEKNKFPGWDGTCRSCGYSRFRRGIFGPHCRHCGDHHAASGKKAKTA